MELRRRKEIRYAQPLYPLTKIGSLAQFIQYGISERANIDGAGVPMIRMNNLQPLGWDLSDLKHIELDEAALKKHRLEPGDILFNRTNSKELVGKCEVFNEPGDWVFASYLIRVRLDRSRALPEFVSAFLNTEAGRMQIDQVSRQIAGMSNVNAEELRGLEVPLPPSLAQQSELLSKLERAAIQRNQYLRDADEVDRSVELEVARALGIILPESKTSSVYAIQRSSARSSRLDAAYHHPRYSEALRALDGANGEKAALGDMLLDIAGGATPKAKDESLYATDGVKFLRILNVKPNRLDWSQLNYITDEVHEGLLKRSRLAANDVLMTITGRVGTAAVVSEEDLPANINQHIVRLRVDASRCLPRYLAAFLNTTLGTLLSNRPVSGGTRIALDYSAIRELPLIIPAIDVQNEVVDIVNEGLSSEADLRRKAHSVWQSARERFEDTLLNGVDS
ncbi:restriction endonuclease subunit S [Sinorhizobium medicae]